MPDEGKSAIHAGKETMHAGLRAITKYLGPLVGFIAGFFSGQMVGGAASLSQATLAVGSSANAWRIAYAVVGMVFAGVGYIFWSLHNSGGWIVGLLGGVTGGFFFGVAFWNFIQIPGGNGTNGGAIESLTNGVIKIGQGA